MASPRVPITLEHDAHRETRDAIFGEHYEVIPVSTGNYGIDGCRYDIQPMPVRNTKFEPSEGSLAHFYLDEMGLHISFDPPWKGSYEHFHDGRYRTRNLKPRQRNTLKESGILELATEKDNEESVLLVVEGLEDVLTLASSIAAF